MRSLLFRHEMKAKRLKNIKSKTYHRLLKKDRLKATTFAETDPEAAKELAMKQEFKRAEVTFVTCHGGHHFGIDFWGSKCFFGILTLCRNG